jgi:phage terminase large subunit-like protein
VLDLEDVEELNYQWLYWVRPRQQLPQQEIKFRNWLILGGRGAGKTRTGAEWVKALALGLFTPEFPQCKRIAIIASTYDDARRVMIEGDSGLLALHHHMLRPRYEPTKRQLTWPNGTVAHIYSAEEPEALRGPQFDAAWCDELAKWRKVDAAWSNLQLALRMGEIPQCVVTTTPRPIKLLRELMKDDATLISRSRTADNTHNLASSFLGDMEKRFGGTNLARQELEGELIDDDPDALWKRGLIEAARVRELPKLKRIVIAVDPPATAGEKANACGIVCAALGADDRVYVLDDASCKRLRPAQWARRVVDLFYTREADRIVAEVNQGGDMVRDVIAQVDATVPLTTVHASRGKRARAEPVAALYEQGRVSHVGVFAELEDEMCSVIEDGASPDRLDALVWAVTELVLKKRKVPRVRSV